ncbi:hypothetical protein ACWEOE_18300 [Amycolatopsis sp. NPDC004368]
MLGIALVPTTPDAPTETERAIGFAHDGFSVVYLSTLAYLSFSVFTEPAGTSARNRVDRTAGVVMAAALVLIVLDLLFFDAVLDPLHPPPVVAERLVERSRHRVAGQR